MGALQLTTTNLFLIPGRVQVIEATGYKEASANWVCKLSKTLGSHSSSKESFIMILLSPSIIFLLRLLAVWKCQLGSQELLWPPFHCFRDKEDPIGKEASPWGFSQGLSPSRGSLHILGTYHPQKSGVPQD